MRYIIFYLIFCSSTLALIGIFADFFFRKSGALIQNLTIRGALLSILICSLILGIVSKKKVEPKSGFTTEFTTQWVISGGGIITSDGSVKKNNSNPDSVPKKEKYDLKNIVSTGLSEEKFSMQRVIVAIWILGSLVMLIRLGGAYFQVWKWKKRANLAEPSIQKSISDFSTQQGISIPIVMTAEFVKGPFLAGLIRPYIFLPVTPEFQTHHVLIHELGHWQRKDTWWQLIGQFVGAIFFFNPLVWYLIRRQEETAEEVCDDHVVMMTSESRNYAEILWGLARQRIKNPLIMQATIPMASFRSSLGKRIERILDETRIIRLKVSTWRVVVLGVMIILFVGTLLLFRPLQESEKINDQSSVDTIEIGKIITNGYSPLFPRKMDLLSKIGINTGDRIESSENALVKLQEDILKRAYEMGIIENLRVEFEEQRKKLTIRLYIQPRPLIESVKINSSKLSGGEDLSQWLTLKKGDRFNEKNLFHQCQKIDQNLKSLGYTNQQVQYHYDIDQALGRVKVQIEVNPMI